MEDAAIRSGFNNLKDGRDYDALFASALCRAKADWIIGINATRLFSCLYNRTLNVGRVQTPTLKMLTDRDAAISTFKKEKYYHVRLTLSGTEAVSEKLSDAAAADELKAACETAQAECISVTREKKTVSPPKLFDLTSLQREANRIYGYTAKQTLDLAQALYEKRLLILSANRQRIFDRRHGRYSDEYCRAALRKAAVYAGRRIFYPGRVPHP